jgi:hypothetical protein
MFDFSNTKPRRQVGKDEARRLVDEVGSQRGHISEKTLTQLNGEAREEIKRIVRGMSETQGPAREAQLCDTILTLVGAPPCSKRTNL